MAFGNYQNSEKKKETMSTNGLEFFSEQSKLQLLFLNGSICFKMHPLLPEAKRVANPKAKYDYDVFKMTALTPKKLYEFFVPVKRLLERINANDPSAYDFKSFGVPSGTGFIEISPASKLGGPEGYLALTIYSEIDETGKPDKHISFVFNKGNYFENYDMSNGTYDKSADIESDFGLFAGTMGEALKALTNAQVHAQRYVTMYGEKYIKNTIKALAEKAGIESPVYGGSGNKSTTTYFGSTARQEESSSSVGRIEEAGMITTDTLPI